MFVYNTLQVTGKTHECGTKAHCILDKICVLIGISARSSPPDSITIKPHREDMRPVRLTASRSSITVEKSPDRQTVSRSSLNVEKSPVRQTVSRSSLTVEKNPVRQTVSRSSLTVEKSPVRQTASRSSLAVKKGLVRLKGNNASLGPTFRSTLTEGSVFTF